MKKVIAIGELVFDIIFRDGEVIHSLPGGSSLNSSVSLARTGIAVNFCGYLGDDDIGRLTTRKLKDESVNTDSISKIIGLKSRLAIAMLDDKGEAHYSFYKDKSHEVPTIKFPEVNDGDIILFGSFFSLNSQFRIPLTRFLKDAKEKDVIIYYDPNFRKSHLPELQDVFPMIIENIKLSNIIRASADDLKLMFNSGPEEVYNKYFKTQDKVLIVSDAANPVRIYAENFRMDVTVDALNNPNTIGAGDAFNAGLITCLSLYDIKLSTLDGLTKHSWKKCIENGIRFSADVCSGNENYISRELGKALIKEWNCSW